MGWKALITWGKRFYSEGKRESFDATTVSSSRAASLLKLIVVKLVLIHIKAQFYILKIPRELFISILS